MATEAEFFSLSANDLTQTAMGLSRDDYTKFSKEYSPAKRPMKSVAVSILAEMKLAIYGAMLAQRISKAELARRLNCHMPQVDRLLNLAHVSKLDQIEAAFRAVGKRLIIAVEDAA